MAEKVLTGLSPERVFHYFEEISAIPRPSFSEKAISDYLVSFARDHGFSCVQDEKCNIIIVRPASPGREDAAPIILQGHMDMVCEKTADTKKDMTKEGLELFVDGDWIGAKGTTLGGDDGIAVAMALALLEDETLRCPRLEFVCTTSEETGMEGATAIDLSSLEGKQLINIDTECEGELICGCAGGGRLDISLPIERDDAPGVYRQIRVDGLLGGHSGTEIDKGRANANTLMARVLRHILPHHPVRLASFQGGEKDNAIPREATAVISLPKESVDGVSALVEEECAKIRAEYGAADPGITIQMSPIDPSALTEELLTPLTEADTRQIVLLLLSLPNGVVRMSHQIEGLVETSLNLGCLALKEHIFSMTYSLRSSVSAAYEALRENICFMAESFGGEVQIRSEYPAWEYRPDSPLQEKLARIYKAQNGRDTKTATIHAGLECGILSKKITDLDAVSIGPNITDIHTPNERMSISSVERVYRWVRTVLEEQ
ncbi:MAG: aminoacyl-histidine dipeptidase [Lachnospiraceae bacterium]|nr:aminoacyl-histidine dipeptidase [Lachnospiraceae bacterium]